MARVWDLMEESDLVKDYPRPCHEKIPNFRGCEAAANRVARLREFQSARVVKVNPSLAQMHLRFKSWLLRRWRLSFCD